MAIKDRRQKHSGVYRVLFSSFLNLENSIFKFVKLNMSYLINLNWQGNLKYLNLDLFGIKLVRF